jgi:hypothetical protein
MTAKSPDPRLLKDLQALRAAAPRPADELLYRCLERVYDFARKWDPKDARVCRWMDAQQVHHRMKHDRFRLIVDPDSWRSCNRENEAQICGRAKRSF